MPKRRRVLSRGLWLVATLAISACGSPGVPAPPQVRELRRSLGGEPGALDPQLAGDTYAYEVLRDAYEGLVTEDPDGHPIPGQADAWEVSPNGLEYRFTLRAGLRWSDGQPLVAEDFARGLRRAVDPATASPNAPLLRVIAGASDIMARRRPIARLGVFAPDANHLVVRLSHPAEFFPALLSHPVAFPYRSGAPVFNGAYRLEPWLPGHPVRASANPFFRDAAHVDIRRVSYFGVADENVELLRFRGGLLDATGGLPADAIPWANQHLGAQVHLVPQAGVFFLGFNLQQGELRSRPDVRRALGMVIDRERLTREVLRAGQVPAYGLVPPGLGGYAGRPVPWVSWTPEQRLRQASLWYAAAGYGGAKPLRLRVLYNRNTTVRRAVLAITLMWHEALGVETELVDEEFGRFLERRAVPEGWDVVRLGWNADYADATSFLDVFRAGSPDNSVGFASENYDAALDRALAATGGPRMAALQEAEAELLDSAAIVPVYFLATRRLVQPGLVTGKPNLMNHNYTRYWRWLPAGPGTPTTLQGSAVGGEAR